MSLLHKSDEALENVIKSLGNWKKVILDICEYDEGEKNNQMKVLNNYVEAFGELDTKFQKTKLALQKLDEELDSDVKYEDIDSLYQQCFESLPEGSANNPQETRIWQAVFQGDCDVREVRIKKKILASDQFEELDDSLMCSNVFAPPLDPISKVVVKNAYKNKKCGHVYEYDTISDYIKKMKAKAKCPYVGCNNDQLRMKDLVQDTRLQSQITQFLQTQNTEDSEEED